MIASIRSALGLLLTTDPQFMADMQALNLGSTGAAVVPKVLKGNRRFDQLGAEHRPCWVSDAGDQRPESAADYGDAMGLVIGSHQQDWSADIELALVWHQQDYDASVDQTDAIVPALVRLLLRNPSVSGTCTNAYVAAVVPDRNNQHPTHSLFITVRVHAPIERDAP